MNINRLTMCLSYLFLLADKGKFPSCVFGVLLTNLVQISSPEGLTKKERYYVHIYAEFNHFEMFKVLKILPIISPLSLKGACLCLKVINYI